MRATTQRLLRLTPVVLGILCILSGVAKADEALDKAKSLYDSGEYAKAIKEAKEIVKENTESVGARRIMVKATNKLTGDLGHLLAEYSSAVAKTPGSAVYRYALGYVYDYRNNISAALREYGVARELNASLPYLSYSIGYIEDSRGNTAKAEGYYNEELDNNPSFIAPYFNLAKIKMREKRYEDAIGFLNKILEVESGNVAAHDQLGHAYYALNKFSDAMEHWKKTVYIDAKDKAEDANVFGLIYNSKGLYVKARHQFFRAIKKDPKNPRFHNNLGVSYMAKGIAKTFSPKKMKWLEEAIAEFKQALELDSNYFEAMVNLGRVYNYAGRQEESIDTYKMTVDAFPEDTVALKALGSAYEYVGQYKPAIKYYNKALRLDKNDYVAMANLGNCYYKQGMKSSAVDQWNSSLKVYPNQPKLRQLINTVFSKSK